MKLSLVSLPAFALVFATATSLEAGTKKVPGKSVAEIADGVTPSLVKVMQVGREGMDGLGAGFVIRQDGLIATNKHVIGEARRIQVETSDGEKHEVTEVYASDVHLDLAILKIAKSGLKPLPLGDSAKLKQGEAVVAMGNPEGLAFSVVEGVVSALRDINEVPMIQVAMPIERGNSGGPLLDRQGRVLGLLTLKSLKTGNLGFAMPVNALKSLIAKPNPVPMSRWLTIGVLDRRSWLPMMGGQWTQHAGIIKAELMGDGFGGRTLCLWSANDQPEVFDVAASVRLDDESGAAGLVFCADESGRHYGFYPTGGKLRLTRFEGPDVYSWTVLAEVEADAYRKGDWNLLRVRVDGESIKCFVNGRQILEQADSVLRGGTAGLCKFRMPAAEFKDFRIGKDLAERELDAEVVAGIKKAVGDFLKNDVTSAELIKQLLADPAASRSVVVEQKRGLERNAAALKNLEQDLHRAAITHELVKQLGKEEGKIELLRCALLVSKHDNPEVDVEQYMRTMERMADELKYDPEMTKGTASGVRRLRKFMFEENGFHGSRHDYASRSNSYLNEVLDDREGLPITLSVIFLELAARLGVKGVMGLPYSGRFMVGYRDSSEAELRVVDVFDAGREMTPSMAAVMVGQDPEASAHAGVEPATRKGIIVRMIRNLLSSAESAWDEEHQPRAKAATDPLPYLNLILAVEPASLPDRFARAVLRDLRRDKNGAKEDVGWLVKNLPDETPPEQAERLSRWLEALGG